MQKTRARRIGMAATATLATAILAGPTYREAHEVEILHDFAELLSYPNRAFTPDIVRAAEYIRGELEQVGVEAELLRIEGASPIVYGELMVPGATRTLGIYVHYDGQAVDPSNWTHPPFEPTLYPVFLSAALVVTIPPLLVFLLAQRRIFALTTSEER